MNLAETQCIHMVKINVLGGLQWKRIDEESDLEVGEIDLEVGVVLPL